MGQHCIQLDEWSYVHVKAEAITLLLPLFLKVSSVAFDHGGMHALEGLM